MPGARNESEELRDGVEKVEDLWYEEEEHGLAEVSEDGNDREGHSREVTESVADKHLCWVPGKTINPIECWCFFAVCNYALHFVFDRK